MKRLLSILPVLLAVLAGPTLAYEIDKSTFSMLPPHCQAKYANMYKLGKVKGLRLANPDKYHPNRWAKRIGNPWMHLHHYCPGLKDLLRARIDSRDQKIRLRRAAGNVMYTITHSKFTPSNKWLLAEAQRYMGEISDLQNKRGDAINWYYKSLRTNPKSYLTYIHLARLLKKSGNYEEALKVIQQGRKLLPKSKSLRRQEQRLMAKLKKQEKQKKKDEVQQ